MGRLCSSVFQRGSRTRRRQAGGEEGPACWEVSVPLASVSSVVLVPPPALPSHTGLGPRQLGSGSGPGLRFETGVVGLTGRAQLGLEADTGLQAGQAGKSPLPVPPSLICFMCAKQHRKKPPVTISCWVGWGFCFVSNGGWNGAGEGHPSPGVNPALWMERVTGYGDSRRER